MGRGGGFIKFVTLLQFYKLSMFPYFVVLDTNYDSITSLLATQILYFGPLRGVMKIRIAVTLAGLGLLYISPYCLTLFLNSGFISATNLYRTFSISLQNSCTRDCSKTFDFFLRLITYFDTLMRFSQ